MSNPDKVDLLEVMQTAIESENDLVEAASIAVLACIQAAGPISLMPNDAIPTTGLLLYVHPKVYKRVRQKIEAANNDKSS
ncbi:MAG: hypothetical protein ACK4M8_02070 [Allorhizobium sp.]